MFSNYIKELTFSKEQQTNRIIALVGAVIITFIYFFYPLVGVFIFAYLIIYHIFKSINLFDLEDSNNEKLVKEVENLKSEVKKLKKNKN